MDALRFLLLGLFWFLGHPALAADPVPVGDLPRQLAAALPGATLTLAPGTHRGPFLLDKPVTLEGLPGAILDGAGQASVLHVTAPDVTIRALFIRNSGYDLMNRHSGVLVEQGVARTTITGCRFDNNLNGVYLNGSVDTVVRNNLFAGRQTGHANERGNGVHIWNTRGAKIEENLFVHGRDGIFITTARHNRLAHNRFYRTRFAIHYMYAHDNEVIGNLSEGNDVAFALMFSDRIRAIGNVSRHDREHGLMLNYANSSEFIDNRVEEGGHKCLFIYNANKNLFQGNYLEGCDIGVHFTAGSERNRFTGNAFVHNRTQLKYVGSKYHEWSVEGRGNYWSDNPGYDLDADGLSDTAYRPNDLVDQVVFREPLAKLLLTSPAIAILRQAQAHFPALFPGGVMDSHPLMRPDGRTG